MSKKVSKLLIWPPLVHSGRQGHGTCSNLVVGPLKYLGHKESAKCKIKIPKPIIVCNMFWHRQGNVICCNVLSHSYVFILYHSEPMQLLALDHLQYQVTLIKSVRVQGLGLRGDVRIAPLTLCVEVWVNSRMWFESMDWLRILGYEVHDCLLCWMWCDSLGILWVGVQDWIRQRNDNVMLLLQFYIWEMDFLFKGHKWNL